MRSSIEMGLALLFRQPPTRIQPRNHVVDLASGRSRKHGMSGTASGHGPSRRAEIHGTSSARSSRTPYRRTADQRLSKRRRHSLSTPEPVREPSRGIATCSGTKCCPSLALGFLLSTSPGTTSIPMAGRAERWCWTSSGPSSTVLQTRQTTC